MVVVGAIWQKSYQEEQKIQLKTDFTQRLES